MMSDNVNSKYSRYRPSGYPIKHRRKVPFEPSVRLGTEYRRLFSDIQEMDRKLDEMILNAGDYMDLVNDAHASNIHWSTRIEGNPLSLDEVRRISTSYLKNGKWTEKNTGYVQDILNHLYSYIADESFGFPWNAEVPMITHALLMKGTGMDDDMIGKIRAEEGIITGTDGFEYMVPCPPEHIADELTSLNEWLSMSPYDAVITATLFFHEFESIHPFTDGNGRTGRTLFHILLQELGLKNSKLCKFEAEILETLETYYDLLGYTDQTMDYGPLIMYMTESLHRAYGNAVIEFSERDVLKDMDETTRTLAVRSKRDKWFTVADAGGWVKLSDQSTRSRLNALVGMDVLEKEGKTNGMRFRFKDPFAYLKGNVMKCI